MKRVSIVSLAIFFTLLLTNTSILRAQCYGTVMFDQHSNASGSSTFTISTTFPNELIMIAYDGWSRPGTGPVTVDGNPATHIQTAFDGNNSGVAETYAYSAPTAGVHNIVCTEPPYSPPYTLNFAASFYVTGSCPLSIANLTNTTSYEATPCITGGNITDNITTTVPGSMIFCNFENNNGQTGPFVDTWVGATKLDQQHEGNGIDASDAYEPAPCPATYTVSCSNLANPSNGCGGIVMILVNIQPPVCAGPCTMTVTNTTINPTCGNNNGSIVIGVTGGTSPYTYDWSPAVSTSAIATGLSAGTYIITIKDANCNISVDTVKLTTTVLNVTATVLSNDLCNNSLTGSGTSTTSGGTGPYTYVWTPSGGTNANVSGLSAGTYTITSTDINGCTGTASITITSPPALTATLGPPTNIKCNGAATGSLTVTAGGGTPVYKYSWTPAGGTNVTASNLTADTYTVTVTDANGCTATASATITQPPSLTVSATTTAPSCGGSNGSATATALGGTPGYKYAWTPVGGTNATASNLSAATYTVTVTDANGCTATATAVVVASSTLTTTITSVNVLCHGDNTGSATAVPNGGTPAYTYLWAPVGQTTKTATGLTAGSYTVTVTDAIGCTATASVTLTQPAAALTLLAAGFPAICNGSSNGQATVIPNGGTTPYTYLWSNGISNANANNLTAGTYTITVTDANGCNTSATAVVTQPAAIQVGFDSDTLKGCYPLCIPFEDLSVDPTPGDTIRHWNWDFGDGGSDTNQNPTHCYTGPGTYSVKLTVTDNNGCTNNHSILNMVTIYQHPSPDFIISPQPTTIYQPKISFTDNSTDPYGIVNWSWNFNDPLNDTGSNLQNPSHSYGDTGIYCPVLTVTNIHGCVDSISHCLVISPQYSVYIPDAFSPNGDKTNDIFLPRGEYIQQFSMNIFDRWGMRIFSTTNLYQGWNGQSASGKVCQEDTYIYLIDITDNLGKKHSYLGKVTLVK